MAEDEGEIQVPLTWVGLEEVPTLAANQIVVQFTAKHEFVLTFGHVTPPILLGTEEERREQLRMVTFAPVKPVARLGLTRQRIEELVQVLTENLQNHDKVFPGE
jgi:hypothetical protein